MLDSYVDVCEVTVDDVGSDYEFHLYLKSGYNIGSSILVSQQHMIIPLL